MCDQQKSINQVFMKNRKIVKNRKTIMVFLYTKYTIIILKSQQNPPHLLSRLANLKFLIHVQERFKL